MNLMKQPIARHIALASTILMVVIHHLNIRDERVAAKIYFARSAATQAEHIGDSVDAAFKAMHATLSDIAAAAGQSPSELKTQDTPALYARLAQTLVDTLNRTLTVTEVRVTTVQQGVGEGAKTTATGHVAFAPGSKTASYGMPDVEVLHKTILHQKWLQTSSPNAAADPGSNLPMLGGSVTLAPRAVTSQTDTSLHGTEESKLLFSVPYYGSDRRLAGTVSALVSPQDLKALLPHQHHALVNVRYGYVTPAHTQGQEKRSSRWVHVGAPDPKLIASSVIELNAFDPRSTWRLWSGLPNRAYYKNSAEQTISLFETGGYIALMLLLLVLLFIQWLEVARNKAQRATEMAEKTRQAHEKTLKAEKKALRLNEELKANMQKLSDTQLELVKSERLAALGQVTATLSHEIRNPLGAIRSSLYVVRQAAAKADLTLDRPLDRIERSVTRCDNLIGDFLEYTRTHKLSFETLDATDFLAAVLDDQALPGDIAILRDFPDQALPIDIDPDRFRRVIINLLDNATQAIKGHRDAGGEVRISCRDSDRGPVIQVADNGPGIPDDVLGKIFEPLFTTKSFGAGLGLATVRQLVEQHGAEMTIDTECGVGTTFTVQLSRTSQENNDTSEPLIQERAA